MFIFIRTKMFLFFISQAILLSIAKIMLIYHPHSITENSAFSVFYRISTRTLPIGQVQSLHANIEIVLQFQNQRRNNNFYCTILQNHDIQLLQYVLKVIFISDFIFNGHIIHLSVYEAVKQVRCCSSSEYNRYYQWMITFV